MNTKTGQILAVLLMGAWLAVAGSTSAYAGSWADVATVSNTMGLTVNALCAGGGNSTDIGCPTYAPILSSNGDVSASGLIRATQFVGDGSGLTGVTAASSDRIVSGTTSVIANNGGNIDFKTGSTLTGYYTPGGIMVSVGISTTDIVSTTDLYAGLLRVAGLASMANISATGGVSVTGNVSANKFIGDGSLLTNIPTSAITGLATDRITSGTTAVTANSTNYISITNAGTTTGYFDTTGRLITPGISVTTNQLSATTAYFSGNVGIGTTAPLARAHVYTHSSTGVMISGNSSSDVQSDLYIWRTSGGSGVTTGPNIRLDDSGGNPSIIQQYQGNLTFWNYASGWHELMRIASNGNVGISTTAPSTTLHVSGTLRLSDGGETCDSNRAGAIKYTGGTFYFCAGSAWQTLAAAATSGYSTDTIISGTTAVTANSTNYISITNAGTTTGYFDSTGRLITPGISVTTNQLSATTAYFSGNVGIGINNSPNLLTINQSTNTTAGNDVSYGIGLYNQGYVRLSLGSDPNYTYIQSWQTKPLIINSLGNDTILNPTAGNVGIGTTAPSSKLEINGGGSNVAEKILSGGASNYAAFQLGRTLADATIGVAGSPGQFDTNSVAGDLVFQTAATSKMAFNTNAGAGVAALTISAGNGNVGINTNTPIVQLHIVSATATHNAGQFKMETNNGETVLSSDLGELYWNTMTHAGDGGIIFRGKATDTGGFILAPHSATAKGIRLDGVTGYIGINRYTAYTEMDVSGTLKVGDGAQTCDTNRAGAIKYASGTFYFCAGSAWQTLAAAATSGYSTDTITSGTTAVTANSTHYISITNAGTTTGYFDSSGRLITPGISVTTNQLSATTAYFSGNVGIGTTQPSTALQVGGNITLGANNPTVVDIRSGLDAGNKWVPHNGYGLMEFYTAGTRRLGIDYNGNIGVGLNLGVAASLASSTLHVSGTTRITSWTMVAANATPTVPLDVSGSVKISGDGTETCTTTAERGKMRINPTTGFLQICQ